MSQLIFALYQVKEHIGHSIRNGLLCNTQRILSEKRGEGFVDSAVKILMAVVIGALLLAGLYLLFSDTILPTLTQRIQTMFNYKG